MRKTKKYYEERAYGFTEKKKRLFALLTMVVMLFGAMLFSAGDALGATVYGELRNSYWKGYMTYSVSSTATAYTVKVTAAGPYAVNGWVKYPFKTTLSGTGFTSVSGSMSTSRIDKGSKKNLITKTFTWKKGTASSAKTVKAVTKNTYNDSVSTASKSFTVPALAKYTVSYNANGGTGAPASQTKYYGRSLTLRTTKPVKKGYTFLGWSKSSTAAYKDYSAGGTYTANASDTLYAVWKKLPVDMICVEGDIIWDDDNNRDGIRPEKATIYIKNGNNVAASVSGTSEFLSQLERKDERGNEIVYTVSAAKVKGYTCSVSGRTVIYKHIPELMAIDGRILWKDDDNRYGARPDKITAELLKYGPYTDEDTGEQKEGFYIVDTYDIRTETKYAEYSWSVYRYDGGKEQQYIVQIRDEPAGYDISQDGKTIVFTYDSGSTLINMDHAFCNCVNLIKGPEIKYTVKNMVSAFEGCLKLRGNIRINADPELYESCFKDTVGNIIVSGDCMTSTCMALRKTSEGQNIACGHSVVHDEMVHDDAVYYDASEDRMIPGGEPFPSCGNNDRYMFGEYEYTYHEPGGDEYSKGWSVKLNPDKADKTESNYGKIDAYVNNEPVTDISRIFEDCLHLEAAPCIPNTVTKMYAAFRGCSSMSSACNIPRGVVDMREAFSGCTALSGYMTVETDTLLNTDCFSGTLNTIDITGRLTEEACRLLCATSEGENVRCGELHEGMTYYDSSEDRTFEAGEKFPENTETGDIFVYGSYEYGYNVRFSPETSMWEKDTTLNGWSVNAVDGEVDKDEIFESIRNIKVISGGAN